WDAEPSILGENGGADWCKVGCSSTTIARPELKVRPSHCAVSLSNRLLRKSLFGARPWAARFFWRSGGRTCTGAPRRSRNWRSLWVRWLTHRQCYCPCWRPKFFTPDFMTDVQTEIL